MTDKYMQAISFANSYFSLVDGLASGLENHLAEDVVLDWFGRTIRGRNNVATFFQLCNANSLHIFPDIEPASDIVYNESHSKRRKLVSDRLRRSPNNHLEGSVGEIDPSEKETIANEITNSDDTIYELSEGDLSNLFKLDIVPSSVEEIERSINRIKLEEEMAPTMKAIKRECGQGDGPTAVETSTIKYVEANGEIVYPRKFRKPDEWEVYSHGTRNTQTWRRSAKLQIAYSTVAENHSSEVPRRDKKQTSRFRQPKATLPSWEEITEMSSRLVPNKDCFGYLKGRDDFLESLEKEISALKDPRALLLSPKYIKDKLTLRKPCVAKVPSDCENSKIFLFKYQIRIIVYEANEKCRVNFLQEFNESKA